MKVTSYLRHYLDLFREPSSRPIVTRLQAQEKYHPHLRITQERDEIHGGGYRPLRSTTRDSSITKLITSRRLESDVLARARKLSDGMYMRFFFLLLPSLLYVSPSSPSCPPLRTTPAREREREIFRLGEGSARIGAASPSLINRALN